LRTNEDQKHLWRALRYGYDLQVIATDHCPFCMEGRPPWATKKQKQMGRDDFFQESATVAPGIETRLVSLFEIGAHEGQVLISTVLRNWTATSPAKLFGRVPEKGTIAVGSDADVVLFNPAVTQTIRAQDLHSNVDYTLLEGRTLQGRVEKVFLRGHLIVDGKAWKGREGLGVLYRVVRYRRFDERVRP
jgi:dihydropyrimidinase